jgi:hypothetical protein
LAKKSLVILSEAKNLWFLWFLFGWYAAPEQNSEMFRFAQHDTRHFPKLSEAIPGITLKAA